MAEYEMAQQPVSVNKLRTYERCPLMYALDNTYKEKDLPIPGSALTRKYWKIAIKKLVPEERHVGPELAHIEDLRGEELAQYLTKHSPEAFASALSGNFRRNFIIGRATYMRRQPVWFFNGQWGKAAGMLKRVAENYYKIVMRDGLPVVDFTDREIAFEREGRTIVVRFDGLRKGMIIENYETMHKTLKELRTDWRITMQVLGFCTYVHDHYGARIKLGVPDELADQWAGNPRFIGPEVTYRYYNLSSGETRETRREEKDLAPALKEMESAERGIAEKRLDAKPGDACGPCRYNVLLFNKQRACKKSARAPQKPMDRYPRFIPVEKKKPAQD